MSQSQSASARVFNDPLFAFIGGMVFVIVLSVAKDLQSGLIGRDSGPHQLERSASSDPKVDQIRRDGVVTGICPERGGYVVYRYENGFWIAAKTTAGIVAMRVSDVETACKMGRP